MFAIQKIVHDHELVPYVVFDARYGVESLMEIFATSVSPKWRKRGLARGLHEKVMQGNLE